LVRAHQGDSRGALASIAAIFKLARSLANEPTLISQMVHRSCCYLGREQLSRLLHMTVFAEEELARLQTLLRTLPIENATLRQGLIGERVMGIAAFEDIETLSDRAGPGPVWNAVRSHDLANFLEHMQRMLQAADLPFPEALHRAEAVDQSFFDRLDTLHPFHKYTFVVTVQMVPSPKHFEELCRARAGNRAADVAIAMERYRRRHGRLPEQLADLVPQFLPRVPIDPFTGKDLCLEMGEDYHFVFSVGPNQTDDSGELTYEEGNDDTGVWVPHALRLPAAEHEIK
jgi:hypothetical protein